MKAFIAATALVLLAATCSSALADQIPSKKPVTATIPKPKPKGPTKSPAGSIGKGSPGFDTPLVKAH